MSKMITEEQRAEILARRGATMQPLRPSTFSEMERFAQMAARSGMVPPAYTNKPEAIMIACQLGSELGLAPMQSLQNVAVIQGRPTVWGDAMPGLVRASGVCSWIKETVEGEGDSMVAACIAQRTGDPEPTKRTFSVADAKRAGLWGKTGPWTQYPQRMLSMRARSWTLRDAFPDVLKGLMAAEEAQDIQSDQPRREPAHKGATIDVQAEPLTTDAEPKPARRTWADFLDALDIELTGVTTADQFDAIYARDTVQKALDTLKNGARERLNAMLKVAQDRTAPAEHEPGAAVDEAAAEVLPKQRKQSVTDWLDALEPELVAAGSMEAVTAICERDDVKAAPEKLTGKAKERLDAMIAAALDRVSGLDTEMQT